MGGADALAVHVDGKTIIKVQVKGRLSFSKKYIGKKIWIAFEDKSENIFYLYDHDKLLNALPDVKSYVIQKGARTTRGVSQDHRVKLEQYRI